MSDTSKLPITRVDNLDNTINNLNNTINDINSDISDLNTLLNSEISNIESNINNLNISLTTNINNVDSKILPGDLCYSLRTEKTGWLLCNGQAVSRTTYADLFAVIGTKFGSGDNSTTFNVPNYSGKFLQMDTSKSIGTNVSAGLPFIDLYQRVDSTSASTAGTNSTVTSICGTDGATPGSSNTSGTDEYMINIANVANTVKSHYLYKSSIYGANSTVQPPASIVNYFIKY